MPVFICSKCGNFVNSNSPWPLGKCSNCGGKDFKKPKKINLEKIDFSSIGEDKKAKKTIKNVLEKYIIEYFENIEDVKVSSISENELAIEVDKKNVEKNSLEKKEIGNIKTEIERKIEKNIILIDKTEEIEELEEYGKYADLDLERKVKKVKKERNKN